MYILQFCSSLDSKCIFRYAKKYIYEINKHDTNTYCSDEYYFHSNIIVKVYPIWRLVSKYYYYIDSNSQCNFCNGRYKYFSKNLKCDCCGYVNNSKYNNNDWDTAFDKRKTKIIQFNQKYTGNYNFKLSTMNDLYK